MNTNWILSRRAFSLALGVFLWTTTGCKHEPLKSKMPVTDVQAPVAKSALRPLAEPRETELQNQIEGMQEQIRTLTARTEALGNFHGLRMGPKWVEQVRTAREGASRPADRVRYLEATKALLARKLQALRAEMKVYEEFESSNPANPRP
jgi:hypothetical protein